MNHARSGYLKLILGPMFSGKSTKLIELIRKYKVIKYKVLTIKNALDNRYSNVSQIVSHNKDTEPCISLKDLNEIMTNTVFKATYNESQVIFIEEAQFFTDLNDFVTNALKDKKTIFVVGLNGDSNQNNFGDIHKLLPKCNDIELLKACCKICMNETPAEFSKRIIKNNNQVHVGSGDEYIPVCRFHLEDQVSINSEPEIVRETIYYKPIANDSPSVKRDNILLDGSRVRLNIISSNGLVYNPNTVEYTNGDLATVNYKLGGNIGKEYWISLDKGGVLKIDKNYLEII
jgi:thymidine kinase